MDNLFVVDVEADGPCPGLFSMIEVAAVNVEDPTIHFHGYLRPASGANWDPGALRAIKCSREDTLQYPMPQETMVEFNQWVQSACGGRPIFVSDNPGFDFGFVNYYFHRYVGRNPFGWSARRIGDFFAGICLDFHARQEWKDLRRTPHTHNALDDAKGNAEALHRLIRGARSGLAYTFAAHRLEQPRVSLRDIMKRIEAT